jgi:hypothetical protein
LMKRKPLREDLKKKKKKKKNDSGAFRMALIPCEKCEFIIFLPIN